MGYIAYVFVYIFLWMISILPFPILYLLSDIICFILYRIIRYRVKAVRYNLALALPYLTDKERKQIEKKFYSHMCDMFLEMVKTLTISENEIKKRYKFTNIEVVKEFEKKGKSIVLMLPHYANWEWMVILGKYISFKGFGIYKKLANKHFDKLTHDIRARFDAALISTRETTLAIKSNQGKGLQGTYLFLSDQTPNLRKGLHWEPFMGVEVPVHMGAEAIAKKLDLNILYIKVQKIKRGYYEATFIPITDNPKGEEKYKITRTFLDLVEAQIKEQPEYYFWTHKRWKHQNKKEAFD